MGAVIKYANLIDVLFKPLTLAILPGESLFFLRRYAWNALKLIDFLIIILKITDLLALKISVLYVLFSIAYIAQSFDSI